MTPRPTLYPALRHPALRQSASDPATTLHNDDTMTPMNSSRSGRSRFSAIVVVASAVLVAGCGGEQHESTQATPTRVAGTPYTLRDTTIATTFRAAGVAEPVRQATL